MEWWREQEKKGRKKKERESKFVGLQVEVRNVYGDLIPALLCIANNSSKNEWLWNSCSYIRFCWHCGVSG